MINYFINKIKYESIKNMDIVDDIVNIQNQLIDVNPEIFYKFFDREDNEIDILGVIEDTYVHSFHLNFEKNEIYTKTLDKRTYHEYSKYLKRLDRKIKLERIKNENI